MEKEDPFNYDEVREKLAELSFQRKQIQRELGASAKRTTSKIVKAQPERIKLKPQEIKPRSIAKKAPVAIPTLFKALASVQPVPIKVAPARVERSDLTIRATEKLFGCVRAIGGINRVGLQTGLQAAGACVLLVKEEDGSDKVQLHAAILAACISNEISSLSFGDWMLERLCNVWKVHPLNSTFIAEGRAILDMHRLNNHLDTISLGLVVVARYFVLGSGFTSAIRFDDTLSLVPERLPEDLLRMSLTETVRAWSSCRKLRFSESAVMVMKEIINRSLNWNLSEVVSCVLIMSILATSFNISRNQSMGTSRIAFCVSLLSTLSKSSPGRSEKMPDVERFACIAVAAAADEFWKRVRSVPSEMTANPPQTTLPMPKALSDSISQFSGSFASKLNEASRSLLGMVSFMTNSDTIQLSSRSHQALVQDVDARFRQMERDGRREISPMGFLIAVLQDDKDLTSKNESAPVKGAVNEINVDLGGSLEKQNQKQPAGMGPGNKTSSAGEMRKLAPSSRLFEDWTSDSSSSWLSDTGEYSQEDFTRVFSSRLNDARATASRYGLFQTSHPDDIARLLEPLPPQ